MNLNPLRGALVAAALTLSAGPLPAQTRDTATTAPAEGQAPAVFRKVDQMPAFKGNLSEYLSSRIKYPEGARLRSEEGRVIVQFTVNTRGRIEELHIVRSSGHPLLDAEALRVLKPMEYTAYWKPGRHKRRLVKVYFTLPVTFKLD